VHTAAAVWTAEDWSAATTAWVDDVLSDQGIRRTGDLVVVSSWALSHVERVPTTVGDLFVKASAEHFAHEVPVTAWLAERFPDDVPNVLAADAQRRCLLMTRLAGVDASTGAVLPAAAATIARLQVGCIGDVGALLSCGAPRRGLAETRTRFLDVANVGHELVELAPEERAGLQAALPWLLDQLAELEAVGIPDTLSHGDLHLGNVASAAGCARVFDWSDACVGHPFLDLAHLVVRLPEVKGPVDPDWYEPYLAAWREGWPDAVLRRAIDLAVVADRMFQAVTLEDLAGAIGPTARTPLAGLQARRLRELVAARG
jgi:Ser/Thr protein kinase RdoA (MazF antagonist)